jgi:hypothetical protein
MTLFETGFKKSFHKVRAYFVGPEALKAAQFGTRLTIATQSPPEFDLKAATHHYR